MSAPTTSTLSSMQSEWLTEDWKPSALPNSNWVKPKFEDAVDQVYNVMNRTTDLAERPYHPGHWLVRAKALHINGYPELAVGDAHKALLLCDAEASGDVELAEKVKSSRGMKLKRHQKKARIEVDKRDGASHQPLDPIAAPIGIIRQEACHIMILALETCKSYYEALEFCQDAAQLYPSDCRFVDLLQNLRAACTEASSSHGGFIARQYPWLSYEHKKRQRTTIASAIAHISGISNGALTLQESKIIAGPSAKLNKRISRHVKWLDHDQTKTLMVDGTAVARPQVPTKDFSKKEKLPTKVKVPDSDVLGVFATRNIPKDTLLINDTTITGAASIKTRHMCGNCYAALPRHPYTTPGSSITWCSALCRDLAIASYHRPIYDKLPDGTLDWVQQAAADDPTPHGSLRSSMQQAADDNSLSTEAIPPEPGQNKPHLRSLLLLRFLAIAINENINPLSHETAAILSGRYDSKHVERFTREHSVTVPCRMLRDLGVDIFADARSDTWVLLTLLHRIIVYERFEPFLQTGQSGQGGVGGQAGGILAVNPCYSMFNHSCEPNARSLRTGTTTVKVVAERDIVKGEEVFLDYRCGDEEKSLVELLGSDGCRCGKCAAGHGDKAGG